MVGGGAHGRRRGGRRDTEPAGSALIARTFAIATVVHVLMLLLEYGGKHASKAAAAAAHMITERALRPAVLVRRCRLARSSPPRWPSPAGAAGLALVVAVGGLVVQGCPAGLRVRVRPGGPGRPAVLTRPTSAGPARLPNPRPPRRRSAP